MNRVELEDYRRHNVRVRNWSFLAVITISAGIGYAVASLWSFMGGALLAVLLLLAGMELHMRLDKARWLKRFPELADAHVVWRRR